VNSINQFTGLNRAQTARQVATPQVQVTPQVSGPQETVGLSNVPRGVCFMPDGQAMYLPKPGGQMVLGRDARCDQVINDGEISRNHARIAERDGKYYLQDLGSTNGTYLNGEQLETGKWVEFKPGDNLGLGKKFEINRSQNDLPEQLPDLNMPASNGAITVGRADGNSLKLGWPETSRKHAVIQNHDGANWIMDQGSSNGTWVNGKKIPSQQWVILQPGAKVQFGSAPGAAFNVAAARPAVAPPLPQMQVQGQFNMAGQQVGGVPLPGVRQLRHTFHALSPQQSQAILGRAQFDPNPMGVRPKGAPDCTQEFLKANGLEPKTTFELGDTKVHFSQPYSLGQDRAACVGYVEGKDGQVHVRAFYRSNSQGLWRSASHAGVGGWIGKGEGEESTNLPIPLQMALHSQAGKEVKNLGPEVANQAFYGSLEFRGHEAPTQLRQQLHEPVQLGLFDQKLPDGYGLPESFHWKNPLDGPNFQKLDVHYTFEHPVHGKVSADCYTSQNGDCSFMFYRDAQGRSWLAQMERSDSPLTSWGTRSDPVEHGDLGMPAVEYGSQIPQGYAGEHVKGSYYDASRYVHRLPPVQQYRLNFGPGN
jgi:pSer/pThr/pTyr-binding forkhead associated (FHA) protein